MNKPDIGKTARRVLTHLGALILCTSAATAAVEISAKPTSNMTCSAGVCVPTAKKAVLNVNDLAGMLASGDVKVVTGNGSVTITVSAPFSWTSTHRLTLDANLNVSFRAPVQVAGTGAVTIVTNDGGTGGDLLFFPGASLDFWDLHSDLQINGTNFTLVNDISSMVSAFETNPQANIGLAKSYDAQNDDPYQNCPVTNTVLGTLEGLGHTIQNLTIKERGHVSASAALFSQIGTSGVVRDLELINETVTSSKTDHGGAAALLAAENTGTIDHVSVSGKVSAIYSDQGYGSGLVAQNAGTISDSQSSAAINASQYDTGGGLVGYNSGIIVGSSATSTVYGGTAGGLVGVNANIIEWSHATGSVNGGVAGGLAGANGGAISSSFSTAPIDGDLSAGGLVGTNAGTIDSTYATGAVTGGDGRYAGGLVGLQYGQIQNSYATGAILGSSEWAKGGLIGQNQCINGCRIKSVYATGSVPGNPGQSGGVVGNDEDYKNHDFRSAYWDIDSSEQDNGAGNVANDPGITGLTDTQLKSGLPSGFDKKLWAQNAAINNGYPYLIANAPPK